MDLTYSIDDVARTSDEAAVRAAFDARTLRWLRLVSIVAIPLTAAHLIAGLASRDPRRAITGVISFAVAVLVVASIRKAARHRLSHFLTKRARAAAIGFALTEAAALVLFHAKTEAAIAFSVLLPLASIGYRLLPAEHVLLHVGFSMISAVVMTSLPFRQQSVVDVIVPPLIINVIVLIGSMKISRDARQQIVADWAQRRASAREQIRMRDELRYARELQLSMLPECAPRLEWADICSISVPASEVGGDYYDYFVERDRVALVCGDVAGHGMASGLVLSALRTGFTLLRDSLHHPAGVLERLHDLVAHATRRRMLVTVAVVLVDFRTRRVVISSAGHPPVIVRHADGSVETIDLYAPPLGVRLPVAIPQRELAFAAGDTFVLHSDGIYETRNAADEVYGLDRLQRIVSERGGGSAEELRDAVLADLAAFRGAREQDDDVTIVVCGITP